MLRSKCDIFELQELIAGHPASRGAVYWTWRPIPLDILGPLPERPKLLSLVRFLQVQAMAGGVTREGGVKRELCVRRTKERCTPLAKGTVRLLREWMKENRGLPDDPLFPTRRGTPLTRSAVGCLVAKHAAAAATRCPSLLSKRPTPHVLRHTCAMSLLHSGCDSSVIALWLGHESVETTARIYLHGDLSIKERALERTRPRHAKPGRYRPADPLLAFLTSL